MTNSKFRKTALVLVQFFDIYKSSWKHRLFLEVEQYYTNYC
jgi:hypothetical protein